MAAVMPLSWDRSAGWARCRGKTSAELPAEADSAAREVHFANSWYDLRDSKGPGSLDRSFLSCVTSLATSEPRRPE